MRGSAGSESWTTLRGVAPASGEGPRRWRMKALTRPVAEKSICVVDLALRWSRSDNSRMRRPASSIRALDFPVRALGPRRSHSTSRRTLLASDSWRLEWASRNSSFFSRNSL